MAFQIYIKRFFFTAIGIFLLSSCGLVGGKNEVDTTENSVLSGPPLAIPPEFDIDSQNTNQEQSAPVYDMETFEQDDTIGSFEGKNESENENIFSDEVPVMTNLENTGEIQNFENFNPNIVRSNKQPNIITNPKIQKTYRSTVPSDSYNFDRVPAGNQKTYAKKKKNKFVGFGNFEQLGMVNTGDLSKEEEFLLEDIFTQENIPEAIDKAIPDFESIGD